LLLRIADEVHDQKLVGQRDLRRSQTQPFGFVHQGEHLSSDPANVVIDGRQWFGCMPQRRVRVFHNLHAVILRQRPHSAKTAKLPTTHFLIQAAMFAITSGATLAGFSPSWTPGWGSYGVKV